MDLSDRLKELKDKAQDAATEHKGEILDAVRKAQATADEQTGGKYHEQIKKAGAKAEEYVEKLTAEKPDEPEGPAASPGP